MPVIKEAGEKMTKLAEYLGELEPRENGEPEMDVIIRRRELTMISLAGQCMYFGVSKEAMLKAAGDVYDKLDRLTKGVAPRHFDLHPKEGMN